VKLIPVLVCALATTAAAETKSWHAIQPHAGGYGIVVGIDAQSMRKSALFDAAVKQLTSASRPREMIDSIHAVCGLDLVATITDATVLFDMTNERGLLVLGLAIDKPKFDDCFTKAIAKLDPGTKVAIATKGRVTTYTLGSDPLALAWIAPNVVVFSSTIFGMPSPNDAAGLDTTLAGGPPTGLFTASIQRANPNRPIWFVANGAEANLPELIGSVAIDGTTTTAIARGTATSATVATTMATNIRDTVTRKARSAKPEAARVLQAVKVNATGTNLTIDVAFPDGDAAGALAAFDKVF
jgi:hypothetical protein